MPANKLIILILAATPEDVNRLKVDEESRAIDQALRMAEFRDRFDLQSHGAVRASDLPELLLRLKPHIVHFSGHGTPIGDTAFQGDDGKKHLVDPQTLQALFTVLKDNVRCVVLNACYSQIQAELIAESIDFVVGMNQEIPDSASIKFATGFYRGLGYDRTIKAAFDLGCVEIGLAGKGEIHRTRPSVSVAAPVGTHVLGGTAAIPQLVALRSDPAEAKLVDMAAAADTPAAATGGITIGKIEAVNVAENQVIDQRGATFDFGNRTQINTGGGDYFGGSKVVHGDVVHGDKVGGDKITGDKIEFHGDVTADVLAVGRGAQATSNQGIDPAQLAQLLVPIIQAVAASQADSAKQAEAYAKVQELQQELAKGKKADDNKLGRLVNGLVDLVPGAVAAVTAAFASPILAGVAGPVTSFVLEQLRGKAVS